MIVVFDTNVLLQALNQGHPFAVILNAWHAGLFTWALSADILLGVSRGHHPPIRRCSVANLGAVA
jgi:predicted nucleic acid-binding protein